MHDPLQDELLSAYLDGELSADERRLVERRLAESPADRRLVEELSTLSRSLQSMPRYELSARFRDDVLRRAERAMLTRRDVSSAPRPAELGRWRWWPIRGLRPLVWPALAVAAALMLMVVHRQQGPGPRDVALGRRLLTERAAEHKDGAPTSEPMMRSRSSVGKGAQKEAGPITVGTDGEPVAGASPAVLDAKAIVAGEALVVQEPAPVAMSKREDQSGPPRGARMPARAAQPDTYGNGVEVQLRQRKSQSTALALDRLNGPARGAGDPTSGVMIVEIRMSHRAAQTQAFDQVLARQQIVWRAEDRWQEGRDVAGRPTGTGMEKVRVMATSSQLRGALTDVMARVAEFPAFEVRPDPGAPRQQPFKYYFRRGGPAGEEGADKLAVAVDREIRADQGRAKGAPASPPAGMAGGADSDKLGEDRSAVSSPKAAARSTTAAGPPPPGQPGAAQRDAKGQPIPPATSAPGDQPSPMQQRSPRASGRQPDGGPASGPPPAKPLESVVGGVPNRARNAALSDETAEPLFPVLFVLRMVDGDPAESKPPPAPDVR
ncbi:MAG: hypothetical protein A2W31_04615 [Planctomycetes bacterium RBG_16_64_10]|nr:MAG: hypothetical protein A2W31_04615 [Planctomycetes bacterium RBG_16_64_10]